MSRLLHECGEALYGPRWQSELARDLDVSIRTMQRWAAGSIDVPTGLYLDLLHLMQERAQVLNALASRLRRAP
jgi:hypothetical protein